MFSRLTATICKKFEYLLPDYTVVRDVGDITVEEACVAARNRIEVLETEQQEKLAAEKKSAVEENEAPKRKRKHVEYKK